MSFIRKIVVVGAGTSGWMAASLIKKHHPDIDVTVVFNSKIPTIGVGETLTFRMPYFMKHLLGLDDDAWIPRCQATYKSGVKWANWGGPGHSHQSSYINEFPAHYLLSTVYTPSGTRATTFDSSKVKNINTKLMITDLWLAMRKKGMITVDDDHIQQALSDQYYFSLHNKSIRDTDGTWLTDDVAGFSYHYNAEVVSNVMGDLVGRPCGVKEIDCNITNVVAQNGVIEYIETDSGQRITADLFIDCSGFKRLLISKTDNEWIASDEFCNNSAIVKQVHYDGKDHPQHRVSNSTLFSRMDSGWRFSVPLQNRSGNGYIFNKNITPDLDQLVSEFNQALDDYSDPRLIQWNPGYYKKMMSKNCVAVGLSLGFSDPFDANNLNLTIHVLEQFIKCLKNPRLTDLLSIELVMNNLSLDYWYDVAMRYKSALRLSPPCNTKYYQIISQAARDHNLLEEFITYIEDSRRRMARKIDHAYDMKPVLYYHWSFTTLATRYGIDLPVPDIDNDLAEIAKPYFETRRARNRIMAERAPDLADFYQTYFKTGMQ